jgi:Icc-related predicted phosphoesterase
MLIIGLSDIHGRVEAIEGVSEVLSRADLVLITGDLTHFGDRRDAKKIIECIRHYCKRLYAVPGNCDLPEVGLYLSREGISLDCRKAVIDGYTFIGIGGSLPCPGKTPNEYTEDEFALKLDILKQDAHSAEPFIFVTHQPPFGTCCDLVSSGSHVGSRVIRNFIIETKPILCLSGHIHEAQGVGTLGVSKVANPGPLLHGGYIYAEVERGNVSVVMAR